MFSLSHLFTYPNHLNLSFPIVSKMPNSGCSFDVLIFHPICPWHSQRNSLHLQLFHLHICFHSLCQCCSLQAIEGGWVFTVLQTFLFTFPASLLSQITPNTLLHPTCTLLFTSFPQSLLLCTVEDKYFALSSLLFVPSSLFHLYLFYVHTCISWINLSVFLVSFSRHQKTPSWSRWMAALPESGFPFWILLVLLSRFFPLNSFDRLFMTFL